MVPLQPGIATEVFRNCLTDPFARAFGVDVATPARSERFLEDVARDVEAGGGTFDVVEWPQPYLVRAKRLGLCESINYEALPNLADVHPRYLDAEGFGVGVFVWGMTLVYNPTLVQRPPTRWADLWSPDLKGRIALRDRLGMSLLMPATCKVLGIATEDLVDDDVFHHAWVKLTELVGQTRTWATSEGDVQDIMASGEVAVSQQFIDVAQVQKDRGVAIGVSFPEEGPIWDYRSWTVVKGSRVPDLARAFIDFAQSARQQKALCESFYGHPVNRRAELDPSLAPRIYGRPTKDEDLSFPDWKWYLMRPDLDERWSRLIAGGR